MKNTTMTSFKHNRETFISKLSAGKTAAKQPSPEELEALQDELHVWVTRAALLVFFTILNVCIFYSQKQYPRMMKSGGGAVVKVSANGHGSLLMPYVNLNHSGNNLAIGPVLKMSSGELNGYEISYSMNLSGGRHGFVYNEFAQRSAEPLQINWTTYFLHLNNALLSNSLIKNESRIRREPPIDWKNVRFSTVELGTGVELRINFSHFLSWRNIISTGVYHHLNYIKGMDHEQTRVTIAVSTGLQFNIH